MEVAGGGSASRGAPADKPCPGECAEEASLFLSEVWSYEGEGASYFAIVVVEEGRVSWRHFSREEVRSGAVGGLVRSSWARWRDGGANVYFQVLPLARRPARGRGSESDVSVGRWLWCDLDYKSPVDEAPFEGFREGEDHALVGYYREGGRWVKVERPPLSEVLQRVKSRLGLEPTIVVDSGGGYHLYFRLSSELPAQRLKALEERLVDALGGDPQSKDLARVLRLPGTVNPRLGRLCRVVRLSDSVADPEDLEARLSRPSPPPAPAGRLRELSDAQVMKVVELLREAYRPGYRQQLLLYLSGWLAKAGVSPLSAVKVAKALYDSTQDQDPLKSRLSAVAYSYRKAGVDLEPYAQAIEALAGARPYGLGPELLEEVKGRSGLQEVLEEVLGEERALAVVHELSELLGSLSPFRDSVVELLDYERQLYAVANLRKMVMVRARREGDAMRYRERVAVVAPTKVVVYESPVGGVRKYEVTFEGATLRRPLVVGPALVEEVADRLRAEGLVYCSRLLEDVLSAVVQAYVRKGRAEVRAEVESPGFYWVDGRVAAVKYSPGVDLERLREALQLLDELAEEWFRHAKEEFSTVVKWGAVAPFSYVLKQRGRWLKWLYLYGDSQTGKTTLGRVVLRMWGLDSRHEKSGASLDTLARLGHVLSSSTFPTLVNEPGPALGREEVVEAMKNAADSTLVRGRFSRGLYVEVPSLSPLIFTSNRVYPSDDAFRRRLIVVQFSFSDRLPEERQAEFRRRVEPRLAALEAVGRCVADRVLYDHYVLEASQDLLEVGEELLGGCYELAGLPRPGWLGLRYEEEEDYVSGLVEEFRERLKKYVNDLFSRYVSRLVEVEGGWSSAGEVELERRLRVLLEKGMVPGAVVKEGAVYVLAPLLRELGVERASLRSLAEVLGWDYRRVKVGGTVTWGAATTLESLASFLTE